MSCSTTKSAIATRPKSVGNIRLTAMTDEDDASIPLKSSHRNNSDELMDALESVPGFEESPRHGPEAIADDSREAISPPVPSSHSRTRSSRVSRVPPQATRRPHSLPVNAFRPLSDGPSAHDPMPLSVRPGHFESFGPIEQFPQARSRLSLIGYVGTICEGEERYNAQLATEVFTYTPQSDAAITHVKKEKWYTKSACRLKKALADRK